MISLGWSFDPILALKQKEEFKQTLLRVIFLREKVGTKVVKKKKQLLFLFLLFLIYMCSYEDMTLELQQPSCYYQWRHHCHTKCDMKGRQNSRTFWIFLTATASIRIAASGTQSIDSRSSFILGKNKSFSFLLLGTEFFLIICSHFHLIFLARLNHTQCKQHLSVPREASPSGKHNI